MQTDLAVTERKQFVLENVEKAKVAEAIQQFLASNDAGMIGFEKNREFFSVWANADSEPI